jgi:GT2 family glycosyltransferase
MTGITKQHQIPEPAAPEVSVIIASYNARQTIGACIRSLLEQDTRRPHEVIVVDSSSDGTGDLVAREFPSVKLLRQPRRRYPGDARNIGVRAARGAIVAFTDADCVADPGWVEAIARAHRAHGAVGGCIANANPESYVGWAAYFCEYSQWLPGQQQKTMSDIPTANLSYKRELFERHGGFIEGTYCSDTDFNWRIGRAGQKLLFAPSVRVAHHNIDRPVRFLRHEYFHGRSFGRVRVAAQRFSTARRLAYAALAPLILGKLLVHRTVKNCASPVYLPQFLGAWPLFALGVGCWTLGEAAGYLADSRR